MKPLNNKHWEGVDVVKYRKTLAELKAGKSA